MKKDYHYLSIREVLRELDAGRAGLTSKEAAIRLKKFGLNRLPEEKRLSRIKIFFNQFKNPLIYILFFATLVSFFLREFIDAGVIIVALALNTIIGFIQEDKAERTIKQLKKLVEYKTMVWRDKKEQEIKVEGLVPGDVISLSAGDKVPADGRLFEANDFQVNEASLTGESLPVEKRIEPQAKGAVLAERKNMVYMGTEVISGRAQAIVTSTGIATYLGEIASLIKGIKEEKTPLQGKLSRFARWLSLIIGSLCSFILIIGLWRGLPFFEIFLTAVAVAVAAIPEGLLVAVTVILALGMQRILRRKSLVRQMIAVETLGSVSVICTDKTGTLTYGEMSVSQILTSSRVFSLDGKNKNKDDFIEEGSSHLLALKICLLNNNAIIQNPQEDLSKWLILGDSTEKALLVAALGLGLDKSKLEKDSPRLAEIPFTEERKYMATLNQTKGGNIIYLKGAVEKILKKSSWIDVDGSREKMDREKYLNLINKSESLTQRGLRVLAIAYKKVESQKEKITDGDFQDLVFVGFVGLKDALREEARETIQLCQRAGIRPIMVTGDHKLTAKAIYEELGFKIKSENIMEGGELERLTDEDLKKVIRKIDIFARVEPKHKLRIIDAWQAKGEVVAMTGDGVNDAPALKSADIGLALGSGTDVAKEAADIILLDNNFKTIVAAVEQGRIIFSNIKKVILYLLSGSFTEVIMVMGSLFLGLPLPISAVQILWVNLIEDGLPYLALAFEPGEKEVMGDPPRRKKESLIDMEMKSIIIIISLVTNLVLFSLFYWFWKITGDLVYTRTMIFVGLGIDSLFYVFSCRNLRQSLWRNNPFNNKFLTGAVILGFLLFIAAIYLPFLQKVLGTVPLGKIEWLVLLVFGFLNMFLIELIKYIFILRRVKS